MSRLLPVLPLTMLAFSALPAYAFCEAEFMACAAKKCAQPFHAYETCITNNDCFDETCTACSAQEIQATQCASQRCPEIDRCIEAESQKMLSEYAEPSTGGQGGFGGAQGGQQPAQPQGGSGGAQGGQQPAQPQGGFTGAHGGHQPAQPQASQPPAGDNTSLPVGQWSTSRGGGVAAAYFNRDGDWVDTSGSWTGIHVEIRPNGSFNWLGAGGWSSGMGMGGEYQAVNKGRASVQNGFLIFDVTSRQNYVNNEKSSLSTTPERWIYAYRIDGDHLSIQRYDDSGQQPARDVQVLNRVHAPQ